MVAEANHVTVSYFIGIFQSSTGNLINTKYFQDCKSNAIVGNYKTKNGYQGNVLVNAFAVPTEREKVFGEKKTSC